jgi:hypothetical protein
MIPSDGLSLGGAEGNLAARRADLAPAPAVFAGARLACARKGMDNTPSSR